MSWAVSICRRRSSLAGSSGLLVSVDRAFVRWCTRGMREGGRGVTSQSIDYLGCSSLTLCLGLDQVYHSMMEGGGSSESGPRTEYVCPRWRLAVVQVVPLAHRRRLYGLSFVLLLSSLYMYVGKPCCVWVYVGSWCRI